MDATGRGPEPKQARARATRGQLLAAATRCFAAQGYRGATLAAIAREAGVTDAGLLYHFPTKAALVAAVLEEESRVNGERLAELYGEGGLGFVRALGSWGELMEADPEMTSLRVLLSAEHLLDDSDVNRFFRRGYEHNVAGIVQAIDEGRARGEVRDDVDPEAEARLLIAVMDGARLQHFLTDGRASMAVQIRAYVHQLVDRIAVPSAARPVAER